MSCGFLSPNFRNKSQKAVCYRLTIPSLFLHSSYVGQRRMTEQIEKTNPSDREVVLMEQT